MLAHLSSTSPYVCDLSRGPIEPANRMASVIQSKQISILLDQKESLPKQTRTPLKLLSPEEIPLDHTTMANDVDASIQPVWYTEQTIEEEEQNKSSSNESEDIATIIREQQRNPSMKPTSLSPIESQYSSVMEDCEAPNQPSLMHKSSTFTIEHESCTATDSQSTDSEKENSLDQNPINPPSEDSFRALEHLLGLGSATTTVRESPKTNHDTLSLTVVTPTDIMNATANTSRASFLPKSGEDSAPSSQTIAPMPTIESMESTIPPSFLAENTVMEDEAQSQPTAEETNEPTQDDSNTDDDTNFSFELNDFANNSKEESSTTDSSTTATTTTEPVQTPVLNIRAPTCADVAFRALIKPRTGARTSQPLKVQSPLANPGKSRSSAPTSRLLRSSCRRISTETTGNNQSSHEPEPSTTADCLVNESTTRMRSLVQVVTVPEEDENENVNETNAISLNLTNTDEMVNQSTTSSMETEISTTPTKVVLPLLSREYSFTSPVTRASKRSRRPTLNQVKSVAIDQTTMTDVDESVSSPSIPSQSMLGVLLTKTEEPSSPKIASKSMLGVLLTEAEEPASPKIASKSMLGVLLTKAEEPSSPKIASKSMLGVLLTETEEPASPKIASKSMLGVLLTTDSTTATPTAASPRRSTRQTRPSVRLSTDDFVRKSSMNPLHSSTPSISKRHSVQMVSIGEEEQVSITVPQPFIMEQDEDVPTKEATMTEEAPVEEVEEVEETEDEIKIEMVPLNDTVPVPTVRTMEIGIQTTPSLDLASRRVVSTMEQQTTPLIQTKTIIHLQRSVRFQLTPTTDARLAEKEKIDEKLRGLKPDLVLPPPTNPLDEETATETVAPKKAKSSKPKKANKPKKAEPKTRADRSRSRSPKAETIETRRESNERKEEIRPVEEAKPEQTRITRKRANTKSVEPVAQTSEPVTKRVKATRGTRSNSKDEPRTRSRSTTKAEEKPTAVKVLKETNEVKRNAENEKGKVNEASCLEKFETMTVANLKVELNKRQILIPKGAKKSDLVALLSNAEKKGNSNKEKKSEIKERVSSIATRTRRQKK